MIFQAIAFYVFSAVMLLAAFMVIAARNPVHSVLFLILAFFNAAGLFVLLGAEFLAMILVVVYVGAVAVLFLFVVMMLDIDFAELKRGALQYLPIGGLLGLVLLGELAAIGTAWKLAPAAPAALASATPPGMSNTEALGHILYTDYVYYFQIAGLVLLVAMIGAIVLTLRHRPGVRRSRSPGRTRAPRTRRWRWSMPSRGRAPDGRRTCTLSHRRGGDVHHRRVRHLPEPQERDRHPDVDRADPAGGEHQLRGVLGLPARSGRAG